MLNFLRVLAGVIVVGTVVGLAACGSPGCFERGTKIKTPTGWAEIQDLKAGDAVMTYDVDAHALKGGVVDKATQREVDRIGTLVLENGTTVQVTGDHPVYRAGSNEATRVDHLNAGDDLQFLGEDGAMTTQKVKALTFAERKVTVFNIKVRGANTSFAAGILARFYE